MKSKRVLAAMVLLAIASGLIFFEVNRSVPQVEVRDVWLPPNYELQSAKNVQPGTFKVVVRTLDEFKDLLGGQDQKVLVVYQEGLISDPAYIDYWVPRKDGIFNYYREEIKHSDQAYGGEFWTAWTAEFKNNSFILSPHRIGFLYAISGFLIFAAVVCYFVEITEIFFPPVKLTLD